MSRHRVDVRLRHMLDDATRAVAFCQGKTRADLDRDEMLSLALLRLLEVIGEAAKHVPENVRAQAPNIPWRQVTGMRDNLIHANRNVDLEIVWDTVNEHLSKLIDELEPLLARLTR